MSTADRPTTSDPDRSAGGRVEREVRWLVDGLLSGDGAMALACHRVLVERHLPWIQRRAVRRARRQLSWSGLGRILGVSRQAVQQRFGGEDPDASADLPPTIPGVTMTARHADRDWALFLADLDRRRRVESHDEAVPW